MKGVYDSDPDYSDTLFDLNTIEFNPYDQKSCK